MFSICKAAALFGFECELDEARHLVQEEFSTHLVEYGISYGTIEEFNYRFDIFAEKDAIYKAHNA